MDVDVDVDATAFFMVLERFFPSVGECDACSMAVASPRLARLGGILVGFPAVYSTLCTIVTPYSL